MTTPKVTVAIPVYNGAKYLAQTLDSLLAQSLHDFELICADDGSSDGSYDILRAYQAKDARIRAVRGNRNLGSAPKVLNALLSDVRGQRFAYASQDDLFSPDWLEQAYGRAAETGADAIVPELEFYFPGKSGNKTLIGLRGDKAVILSNREAVRESLEWSVHGFALWSTELVKRVRFFDFSSHADEYTTRVMLYHCNKVAFSGGRFYYRQDNPEAITKKFSGNSFDAPITNWMIYKFLVEEGFPEEDQDQELLRTISSLIWMRQQLALKGGSLSAEDRKKAQERLTACFAALREPHLQTLIRRRLRKSSFEGFVKSAFVTHGPRFFEIAAVGSAWLRRAAGRVPAPQA